LRRWAGQAQRKDVDRGGLQQPPRHFAEGDVTDTCTELMPICISESPKAALSAYEYILSL